MDTRTIKVFKLQELGDDAFRRAIDDHREILVEEMGWWEPIYEGATEKLEALGFQGVDIRFSGFGSQGDGASFEATIDLDLYYSKLSSELQEKFQPLTQFFPEQTAVIKRSNAMRYVHENMIDCELDGYINGGENEAEIDTLWDELQEHITEHARTLSKEIYKDLEQYYYDLTEEDAIADHLEANDYLFLENGERWHD